MLEVRDGSSLALHVGPMKIDSVREDEIRAAYHDGLADHQEAADIAIGELLNGITERTLEIERLQKAVRFWQDAAGDRTFESGLLPEREKEIREAFYEVRGHAAPFALGPTSGAVEGRAAMTIEPHGPDGFEVLYLGRGPGSHGLNIVTLSDPSYQWPSVREWLLKLPLFVEELLDARKSEREVRRERLLGRVRREEELAGSVRPVK